MSTDRRRLAGALVLLMLLAPLTNAATSSWSGPSSVNPDESVTVSGFQVPGNATILDGWLHVTDSQMASDTDSGFTWEGADLNSGVFYNTEFTDAETISIKDDGTRSSIDTFDSGNITVSMNDRFTYTPGWERVYEVSEGTNLSSCNGGNGTYLSHGPDNDFDANLDSGEITDVIYYCSANALSDVVTGLTVANAGSGYSAGTLSASGGGGSGFSGNYSISSGIESITVQSGGTSYSVNSSVNIICPGACGGSGATAYVGSVSSSGTITSVVVSNSGSGYTSSDTVYAIPSGGSGAQLVPVVGSSGPIHGTEIISGGSGYTSAPSISISDTTGSSGSITATLGGYFDYELTVTSEEEGSNCGYGGYQIDSGLDVDEDGTLDTNEVSSTEYICNGPRMWQATTLSGMNGTLWGDQINMSYGVIPAQATEGLVVAATLPGEPLPAGTDTFLLTEAVSVPDSSEMNAFYVTFDHWYHLDSTSSGGGDGAWVEYRIRNGPAAWGDWTWIAPDGGYPSTISSDAPAVTGAPTGTMPVFASTTHSGWVSSNISLQSISGISSATHLQLKFHVWTDPNAANERPGWFVDNIHFNNDGVDYGVWHHGCYTTTAAYCNYLGNAYGALQRTIDLTGTNSTSAIEIDMEWDLYGYYNDNACVELSLNNNTWTDISSSTSSTASNCEDRSGAIPGYGYSDASGTSYGQQSNGIRTISLDIPSSFRNQANVHMRIIVDTDQYTHYGGSYPGDEKEGLTVDAIRVVDYNDTVLFQDLVETPASMFHYGATMNSGTAGSDQWVHYIWTRGTQSVSMGFEDSTASDPTTNNAAGWSKSGSTGSCGWQYGQLGSSSGAGSQEPSFPYLYGTNLNGVYCNNADAYVISPTFSIPANGSTHLTFDKWICTENYWDAIGLYIKVNNGGWQYFDPGIAGWYDGSVGYSGNAMYGNNAWMSGDCNNGGIFETLVAPLDSYAGDDLKFRFRIDTDSSVQYAGGYIDNFGVLLANYGEGGAWLSPSMDASAMEDFNLGWIDVTASIPNDTWVRGTLVDKDTGIDIPGFRNVSFPISLSGVDTALHPEIRLKVLMDTNDEESTPQLFKVHVGGKRVLAASSSGGNGWDLSTGVEVVDGVLNATSIAGTITSQFTPSSRPIKSVSLAGNYSGGIMVTILDSNGATLGQTTQGGVSFTYPQPGFGVSVSLPTNGWIDRLVINADFAEPADSPSIDVLADGSTEWSFPIGSDYGHYGWQSLISDGMDTFTTSDVMYLDGSTATTVNVRLPANGVVNNGIVSVAPDSDGFESSVSVSIAGASQSSTSLVKPFHSILDSSQIMAINAITGSHTDTDTGRVWKEVPISISSNTAQTVSLTRLGISYLIFENVSGLGNMVSDYHDSQTQDDPPPTDISIPVTISATSGAVSIDGDLRFDYVLTNRDFQVPNTLHPDGNSVEIETKHHHLDDNSMISHITLRGTASDGQILMFEVENSADGLWGQGADSVSFTQTSGSSVAPMGASSVTITTHNDGFDDVTVNWVFDVNWNWDDVDSIRWVAQAYDEYGETVWPAVSHSGQGGSKAVENDLQIDSFEVRDEYGRLLSNQYSSFYPFPAKEGNDLNITGTVRFQDAPDARPDMSDFQVGLNMSGSLFSLTVGDDGQFGGIVTPDPGLSQVTVSPMMLSVGPTGYSVGAEDVTGVPPQITVTMDSNPPVAGPIQVNTPTGLQNAHAKVWEPTVPLSVFVTIDEGEARGEVLTLRYWRGSVDDANSDGIADESEYQAQSQPLSSGMTGQQQVNFVAIDVSAQEFNSPVHLYLEGTDWSGLSYQDGNTGGGPGAQNSWATVIVATDEPTSILSSGYDLDSEIGFLLAGVQHTFTMQIDEANGIDTLDNVTVMLCGDGPTQVGKMSYDPSRGTLWSASDSLVTPVGAQTQQITSSVTQLSIQFELSWYFPWEHDDPATEGNDAQSSCKPSVSIMDDLNTVAYQNNIGELSWDLDNRYVAIPDVLEDLTPPIMENDGSALYLRQGDEFTIDGHVYYAGSGVVASDIPDDLIVEAMVVYGTQEVVVNSGVESDGSFSVSMVLPARVPLNPTMPVQTDVLNVRGEGSSISNSDVSVTVDSKSPTALFDQVAYPDSSLTIIESDLVDDVTVTITMNDEIGMQDENTLQVAWYYLRGGIQVAGTEDTGELQLISEGDGSAIYQAHLDFTPLNQMKIEQGDQIAFYVTSTDKAGNEVSGLGSESAPRIPTLRIMEFLGQYSRSIVSTATPLMGETVKIDTFWENPGKRDGTITVGLYELTLEESADGTLEQRWRPSVTTQSGDTEIDLPAETTSVRATFMWEATSPGQPDLYLVMDIDGDGQLTEIDFAAANTPVTGISVVPPPSSDEGTDSSIMIIGAVVVLAIAMIGFFMTRGRGDDDYYYDDEDDEYYEDEPWGEDED